jgi:FtsH-binding integral membrane protein
MKRQYNLNIFKNLLIKKRDLLKCIFSTLLFQVSVTSIVVYFIKKKNYLNNKFVKSIAFPITILVINIFLIMAMLSQNMPFYSRFILFILFSIINGLLIGTITKFISMDIINTALASTCLIFLLFLIVGFIIVYFNIDLSWMGIFLLYALLGYLIYLIASYFIPAINAYKKYGTTIGLILFSIFILYDTNNILLKYEDTNIDCIRGSLNYYQDIINIFIHMLRKQ